MEGEGSSPDGLTSFAGVGRLPRSRRDDEERVKIGTLQGLRHERYLPPSETVLRRRNLTSGPG